MDATKSYIKFHNISVEDAEDFEFDFTIDSSDILSELVPSQDDWGELNWGIELDEYEYNANSKVMYLTLDTKWESPIEWLKNASKGSHYFENKLVTMTTIQKDETRVTGVAIMDGTILQNKSIWDMDPEEVSKYYNDDEPDHELDDLDNKIWDSIGQFVSVCEKFYLGDNKDEA
jgi:hypothetical protein